MPHSLTLEPDRLTADRDRRAVLRALRRDLRAERRSGRPSRREQDLARRLRASRERIAGVTGELSACAGCAVAYPPPASRWDGGYCCSGRTAALFDELELAALGTAGTRPRHFKVGPGDLAGCLFRAPQGCVLPPGHRPNKCLRFLCRDAQRELHARGDLSVVEALSAYNEQLFAELAQLRLARHEQQFCDRLERVL